LQAVAQRLVIETDMTARRLRRRRDPVPIIDEFFSGHFRDTSLGQKIENEFAFDVGNLITTSAAWNVKQGFYGP
jgi:hypothetical protein